MTPAALVAALAGIVMAILFARLTSISLRLDRLSRVDAKLDTLLAASGVTFDPIGDVPADVREALEQGQTILAIKRYRQAKGVDLKEAKEFVDEVRRRQNAPTIR